METFVPSMNRVHIHGEYEGQELCGYCHSAHSVSYGMTAETLEVNTYDKLINIGWRRSGNFLYKPVLHKTCCPSYTIRLDVGAFQISKNQRQVLLRFERYLSTGSVLAESSDMETQRSPSELLIELVPAEYSSERFELYKKYQMNVHNDSSEDVTELSFTRFLCSSPLRVPPSAGSLEFRGRNLSYGSYHQLYRINDDLIAVSVVDILPSGLSSVYAFYDPDKRYLALGKYTALQEIDLCRTLGLRFYYMGFYIHSCEKMRYKGEYQPSELMCPTSLEWYPLKNCIPLIEKHKFTPFEPKLATDRDSIPDDQIELLQTFAPHFRGKAEIEGIRLDLGMDHLLNLTHLNKRGVEILIPILTEFLNQTGYVAEELIVKLR